MIRHQLSNLSENNSSFSSIGKSSIHWSFSKARRFKHKSMVECPELLDLPSTLEKRSTTFGFGKRYELVNATGKDAPSADKYSIPSCFETEKKGPSMAGGLRDTPGKNRPTTPGPGTYDLGTTICKDGPKFSFRPKFHTKDRFKSPPPGSYNPKFNLMEKNHYSEITFGVGPRSKEGKTRPSTPGPGTYEIPSCFVKISGNSISRFYSPVKGKIIQK
jgi:hypothetical protein